MLKRSVSYEDDYMPIKTKGVKKHKEGIHARSAYEAYKTTRNIEEAYNLYMQENVSALTTLKKFISWASENSWQERVNRADAEEELQITQATRRAGLSNSLTAEELGAELMQTAREEMELKRGDMNHRDIARYMSIAVDINKRWSNVDMPHLVVNVGDGADTVDIDPDVLRKIGREMVLEGDE